MTRHEQRYKAMTILYQAFLYDSNNISYDINDIIDTQMEEKNKFIEMLVNGVIKTRDKLDELANKYLDNWDLDRLGKTDRAILRLSTYEMMYYDTPKVVVINEAVELAKKYSDDKVVKLINAVLDKVRDNEEVNE